MSETSNVGYRGGDLLRAAAAAAERAPQLAAEIRARADTVRGRLSAGSRIGAEDIDVRTLIGLIEQAGVEVPMASPPPPG